MSRPLRLVVAVIGAAAYACAGGVIGAQNAGWLNWRDANALLPFLGLGGALVIIAVRNSSLHEELRSSAIGHVGGYLLLLGAILYVVSWVIQFAIFGTLTFALGLFCIAVSFWGLRLGRITDRVLVTLSAIGSITWNTETQSAFLLVAVGLIWVVLSFRLLNFEGFVSARANPHRR